MTVINNRLHPCTIQAPYYYCHPDSCHIQILSTRLIASALVEIQWSPLSLPPKIDRHISIVSGACSLCPLVFATSRDFKTVTRLHLIGDTAVTSIEHVTPGGTVDE